MKRVLATSSHPGGINAILPVIRQLNQEGQVNVISIGHESSEKMLAAAGISYRTLSSYGVGTTSEEELELLIERVSPNIVLTGTGDSDRDGKKVIEQTIVSAARNAGITSLSVLDVWANYSLRFSDPLNLEEGHLRFLPDKVAVMDELARSTMVAEGFPIDRLVVTGNPFFDDLVEVGRRFGSSNREEVRADLGVSADALLLLYASQPIEHHYGDSLGYTEKTALDALLSSLNKTRTGREVSLLVKVHPRENIPDLEEVAEKYSGVHVLFDQDYPTRPTVLASDVVFSPFSTVLIESTYLHKPSIRLQPGLRQKDLLVTNELGVTVPIYTSEDLDVVVQKVLSDESYLRELSIKGHKKGFVVDGDATDKVTSLVYSLL